MNFCCDHTRCAMKVVQDILSIRGGRSSDGCPPKKDIGRGIKEKYRFIQRGASKTFSVWSRGSSFSADGILLYGLPSAQDSTGLRVWKGAAG